MQNKCTWQFDVIRPKGAWFSCSFHYAAFKSRQKRIINGLRLFLQKEGSWTFSVDNNVLQPKQDGQVALMIVIFADQYRLFEMVLRQQNQNESDEIIVAPPEKHHNDSSDYHLKNKADDCLLHFASL